MATGTITDKINNGSLVLLERVRRVTLSHEAYQQCPRGAATGGCGLELSFHAKIILACAAYLFFALFGVYRDFQAFLQLRSKLYGAKA